MVSCFIIFFHKQTDTCISLAVFKKKIVSLSIFHKIFMDQVIAHDEGQGVILPNVWSGTISRIDNAHGIACGHHPYSFIRMYLHIFKVNCRLSRLPLVSCLLSLVS